MRVEDFGEYWSKKFFSRGRSNLLNKKGATATFIVLVENATATLIMRENEAASTLVMGREAGQ